MRRMTSFVPWRLLFINERPLTCTDESQPMNITLRVR